MRSLFIISLPRSLSTLVFDQACLAINLHAPGWVSSGELLNPDRWFTGTQIPHGAAKFIPAEKQFQTEQLLSFLSDTVKSKGHCYKDVTQPFATSKWLINQQQKLAVIRIERPLTDIAYAMQAQGWRYPANAINNTEYHLDNFLNGLIIARNALRTVPAISVPFDDLIHDETTLATALQKLYPNNAINSIQYITPAFSEHTRQILSRRKHAEWLTLNARLSELENEA